MAHAIHSETVLEMIRLADRATASGCSVVFVHKPDLVLAEEHGEGKDPAAFADVILSNSKDPKVIAALLGNAETAEEAAK